MRHFTVCASIAAALLLPTGSVHAQTRGVPTMTRLVKIFLDQETKLQQAGRDANERALAGLLAEDFEERSAARPGEPLPRADWLRGQRERLPAGHIEQMAAHDHGCVVVVSYLLRPEQGPAQFIVDTWAREGDSWKLKVRYSAPAPATAAPAQDARPTGKG
jgi:hypothetical protein